DGERALARDLVHIFRSRFLADGTWHERIRLRNYSNSRVAVSLLFDVDADFADIFEVRGTARARHGVHLEPRLAGREMRLAYRGLDDEGRWTTLEGSDAPTAMAPRAARFEYELTPHKGALLTIAIRCERDGRRAPRATFEQADDAFAGRLEQARAGYAVVETSSEQFNRWVHRSAADLRMLVSQTPHG